MTCSDECAVEKTEAKEFAYFSGLSFGAKAERDRIIQLFETQNYRYGKVFVDEIIKLIKGEKQ
jgi:hypothetical protein